MKQDAPKERDAQQAVHSGLYAALAAAQAEMGRALKDSSNPHFKSKYADLASVMDACMPALTRHGIAVLQPAHDEGGERFVKTILVHGETGESVECRVPLIVSKNDMQGYGSAVTYARRYGLMGMAGIAPEDDDGHAASKSPPRNDGPSQDAVDTAKASLGNAGSLEQLRAIWSDLPKHVQNVPAVIRAKDERKAALSAPDQKPDTPADDLDGDKVPY